MLGQELKWISNGMRGGLKSQWEQQRDGCWDKSSNESAMQSGAIVQCVRKKMA